MSEIVAVSHFGIVNFGTREDPLVVLVQDANKRPPPFWKMTGGGQEEYDTPEREVVYLEKIAQAGGDIRRIAQFLLGQITTVDQRTVIREIYEELRIRALPTLVVMSDCFKSNEGFARFLAWETQLYLPPGWEEIVPGSEIKRVGYFSVTDLDRMITNQEILPRHANAIDRYLHRPEWLNLPRAI